MSNTITPEGHFADEVNIPTELLRVEMSPTALRLWIAFAKFRDTATNECFPSNRSLLRLLPQGTNERTLRRAKLELEAKGLLTVQARHAEDGRGLTNLYVLISPVASEEQEEL